jgi:hypothetical protein
MNRRPVSLCRIFALALIAGCQGKSEPDPPRPPRPVIEARSGGVTTVRIVAGYPCRAEIDGNEFLVGTQPLVTQVGSNRWTGDDTEHGTTLRRDGMAMVRIHEPPDASVEVFDQDDTAILRVTPDGGIANARGEILRRAEPTHAAIRIGDAVLTGTSDVALGLLVTAPELVPEIRALAACRRLARSRSEPGRALPDVSPRGQPAAGK